MCLNLSYSFDSEQFQNWKLRSSKQSTKIGSASTVTLELPRGPRVPRKSCRFVPARLEIDAPFRRGQTLVFLPQNVRAGVLMALAGGPHGFSTLPSRAGCCCPGVTGTPVQRTSWEEETESGRFLGFLTLPSAVTLGKSLNFLDLGFIFCKNKDTGPEHLERSFSSEIPEMMFAR